LCQQFKGAVLKVMNLVLNMFLFPVNNGLCPNTEIQPEDETAQMKINRNWVKKIETLEDRFSRLEVLIGD
jgi:hypothetical protein